VETKDRFDLPVTSASGEAVADYVAAVDLLLSANTGGEERLARAIAADPDFALAHIARARLLQLQARMPEARAAAAQAGALRDGALSSPLAHRSELQLHCSRYSRIAVVPKLATPR
jgi:hypothetical protein